MDRREAIKLLGLTVAATVVGCKMDDDSTSVLKDTDEGVSEYARIKIAENQRVQNLLSQYAKGRGPNNLDMESYDRLNIAFMTDSHIDLGHNTSESVENVKDAIDFCNSSIVPISAIIQGGDVVTKIKSKKQEHISQLNRYFELAWRAKMPLLFTKGNHDLNAINVSPAHLMGDKDWGDVWFDRAESQYGIVRNKKYNGQKSGYYYYDLEAWKVRIICVDCFDVDYTKTDSKGDILYWGGTSYFIAEEQFKWIVNKALDFDDKEEKDWGVIVFTHFYRPSDVDGTSVEPKFESIYKSFNSMLLAFNKQSSYKVNYTFPKNSFYNLSVVGDWTRYSGLEKKPYLICVLSGHLHTDIYMNWWGNVHIVTANQFCGKEYSDERIERKGGTRTQNLFDILNIDLKERKIRVIRYGASANLDGIYGNRFLPDGQSF